MSASISVVRGLILLFVVSMMCSNATYAWAQAPGSDLAEPFKFENLSPTEQRAATEPGAGGTIDDAGPAAGDAGYSNAQFLRDQLLLQAGVVILICVVTMMAMGMLLFYLFKVNATAGQMVNGAGLTLIIFGTVFLAYTVNDKDQLIASVGIMGAIAGYLFGTASARGGASPRGTDRSS